MKNYKSMRGVNIDLAKLMAKADKSISVGNTQTNARGDQLGRGGRVIKSADEIARDHYNANNPKAVVKSSIKVDNTLDASSKKENQEPVKQEVDDWEEPEDDSKITAGERGIRARWAEVYAVGPENDDVKVGDWVLMDHGRWTEEYKLEDDGATVSLWMGDPDGVLGISNSGRPDGV